MKRLRKIPVTDHAVLRWIERLGHVDVEEIRKQIYSETFEALKSGATRLEINGTQYRMKNGVVVTLISKRKPCRPLRWLEKR